MTGAEPAEPTDQESAVRTEVGDTPAAEPAPAAQPAQPAPPAGQQNPEPEDAPTTIPAQRTRFVAPGEPVNYFAPPPEPLPASPDDAQAAAQAVLKRKRTRRRIWWGTTAGVAAVAIAAVSVVATNSGRHGDSTVSAVTCAPATPSSCLIKPPSGARQLAVTPAWDTAVTPTIDMYAANITGDTKPFSGDTSDMLNSDGVSTITHTDWNAVDGDNVDLVLIEFKTAKGAQAWNTMRTAEILAAYPGPAVSVPGDTSGRAHAAAKTDSRGDVDAAYSTVVGRLVLNVAYSSPGTFAAADLRNWAGTELASLRTAPKPAADTPDAATVEHIACGELTSCLPSRPSGMNSWQIPPGNRWVASDTLSQKQYVKIFWDSGFQSEILGDFSEYDVTGIAHTDWANYDAYQQADVYLIQTLTEPGASELYDLISGEPKWGNGASAETFPLPGGVTGSGWHTTGTGSTGMIDSEAVFRVGNVIAEVYLFFDGSWNANLADQWISATAAGITASLHSADLGVPSLAAPKITVPSQGSCPSSGDCLLPLPSGATDTTADSKYQSSANVSATNYAGKYDVLYDTDYATWLGNEGFQSAEHRSWTAANGATADAVLLKFTHPAQAQASALAEYGVAAETTRTCTVAAVSNAVCFAETVSDDLYQTETVDVLGWKGDYEVRMTVTISNQADLADAYAWLEQQLSMVPAN